MVVNGRIRAEIEERLKCAEAALGSLPAALEPIARYYRAQALPNLVALLEAQLIDAFPHWQSERSLRAAGIEWYYDGRSAPSSLGYGYSGVVGDPRFGELVGSRSARARDDFDGGLELVDMEFGDSAGIDVAGACFPLYECAAAGLEPDADDAWDRLVDVYTLRMFLALHLAAGQALASKAFRSLNVERPFYLWANNHDWSPFLIFALEGDHPEDGQGRRSESTELRVPALADWLDGITEAVEARERKKKLLASLGSKTPAEWDAILRGLPHLADPAEGVTLSIDEMKSLGWQRLSDPSCYRQVSFDAFAHLFRLIAASDEPGLYELHYPFVYLFLRDPDAALVLMRELSAVNPELGATIEECAACSLRWASESPETRWPNPTLALSESPEARRAIQKLV